MNIDKHIFFTDKELQLLRKQLGEYAEVIMPSDVHFIMQHTGMCWGTTFKHLVFNDGDISVTITDLQR